MEEGQLWRTRLEGRHLPPQAPPLIYFPSLVLPLPFFFLLWNTHYSGSFLSINLGNFDILNPLIASNLFIPCHFYSDCRLYFKIIEVFPIISFRFIKKCLSLQRCKSGMVALTLEPRSRMCSLSELPVCFSIGILFSLSICPMSASFSDRPPFHPEKSLCHRI